MDVTYIVQPSVSKRDKYKFYVLKVANYANGKWSIIESYGFKKRSTAEGFVEEMNDGE